MIKKKSIIFVTGHKGLVGSSILRRLKFYGYENIITKTKKQLNLKDQSKVFRFFKSHKIDAVINAAGKVGGIHANNKYKADFIYDNISIQNNIIHSCYKNNIKHLIFLGSSCIYPRDAKQPIKEKYLLTGELEKTNEPYAIAKIAGIKMCESYNLQYGTNFISVMPTNLYGPNDNFDLEKSHVLPALIRKMHLGKALENNDWESIITDLNSLPIEGVSGDSSKEDILSILDKYGITMKDDNTVDLEIWGSGNPMREFLWSEDMADACVFLMEQRDFTDCYSNDNKEIRNTHINIGTGIDISIKDLSLLIKQKVNFKGNLYFNTDKPDGTLKKLTDPSKLHGLGWKHTISLETGVQKVYSWYLGKN